jgi:hypothetical protein
MRLDFSQKTKETLAKRVGYICSNPDCRKLTIGPNEKEDKSCNIGVAAHIYPASFGGPRASNQISDSEITEIKNGIWLCSNCSNLIDRNEEKYTVELLNSWKRLAENYAESLISTNRKETTDCIKFDGYIFDSPLDATWAAFFKLIGWAYVYKPINLAEWQPKFQISTQSATNSIFLVDITFSQNFNAEYRKRIAKSTNYMKNILILDEHPFRGTDSSLGYPNVIGYTSLEEKLEDEDQEYCVSIVYNFFGEGLSIHNLCNLDSELHDMIDLNNEFCRPIWKKSKNLINEITTGNIAYT